MDPVLYLLLKRCTPVDDMKGTSIQCDAYLSGQEIGSQLNISRAGVWKHIQSIKRMGIEIESIRKRGYRIISLPSEHLIPEWIRILYESRTGNILPFGIDYFPSIGSTNTYLKQTVIKQNGNQTIVLTDYQNAGRGRMSRNWISQPGKDITFSLAIRPECEVSQFYYFVMMTSLSVFRQLKNYTNEVSIKWPNDVYLQGKKISGILLETINEQNRIEWMIIGIGININSEPVLENAISLRQAIGRPIDRHPIIAGILAEFISYWQAFHQGYFEKIFLEWKEALGWLGKEVTIETGGERITGRLHDVEPNGSVLLEVAGKILSFTSGDLSQ